MNIKKIRASLLFASALCAVSLSSHALIIGSYDTSRELYGFEGNDYLSEARQWLIDNGHTIVTTSNVDDTFLGSVDAFYTGLISSVSAPEILAMQDFVDVDGGFLFIQQDHDDGDWHSSSSDILSNWGIGNSAGSFFNDSGHVTVGSSSWVSDPNVVAGFSGSAHSTVNEIPDGFEVIARDSLDRVIMGVFDAGAGRSSDVFVATDIDFWSDNVGWQDTRNQMLWENIWNSVEVQIDPPDDKPVDDVAAPQALAILALGVSFLLSRRKRRP